MINKIIHDSFNSEESYEYYINQLHFTDMNKEGPLGNKILLSPTKKEVVRIGHDVGYDIFVSSLINGRLVLSNVVKIHEHYKVIRPGGVFYTITEMERLNELDSKDILALETWRAKIVNSLNQPIGISDPYFLLNDFVALFSFINGYKNEKLAHDYLQTKNIMKRGGQFIIIDPFA
ncbi:MULTISPECIES: hypothetical protein [Enterobacter]|uniref:hypothetical protein n=1 Tax=Enterobacter TaxID=547 RepID=UPI000751644F|nr:MULTISPECIES: hypothetical protein [Enterobacter]KUQ59693.1 hypothetical protein AWI23_17530 [Enterobacter kobei]SAE67371.1 Uncharacterised protein [Enterobacter kobei]